MSHNPTFSECVSHNLVFSKCVSHSRAFCKCMSHDPVFSNVCHTTQLSPNECHTTQFSLNMCPTAFHTHTGGETAHRRQWHRPQAAVGPPTCGSGTAHRRQWDSPQVVIRPPTGGHYSQHRFVWLSLLQMFIINYCFSFSCHIKLSWNTLWRMPLVFPSLCFTKWIQASRRWFWYFCDVPRPLGPFLRNFEA